MLSLTSSEQRQADRYALVGELRDLLWIAVLEHVEGFARQPGDERTALVHDGRRDGGQVDVGMEGRRPRRGRLLRDDRRAQHHERDRKRSGPHAPNATSRERRLERVFEGDHRHHAVADAVVVEREEQIAVEQQAIAQVRPSRPPIRSAR